MNKDTDGRGYAGGWTGDRSDKVGARSMLVSEVRACAQACADAVCRRRGRTFVCGGIRDDEK
jgi:hypothetical protein